MLRRGYTAQNQIIVYIEIIANASPDIEGKTTRVSHDKSSRFGYEESSVQRAASLEAMEALRSTYSCSVVGMYNALDQQTKIASRSI